jgi:hypothetical protein
VDTNDSGDISFEEFSSWLVRQLGPKLMQNISESVQHTMRTQDKVSTTPESMKASRVSQTPQSASPSTPVGPAKFSFAEKSPSFVSTSPHLQDFTSAHGKGFLPNASYFGLQVSSLEIFNQQYFIFLPSRLSSFPSFVYRLVSITLTVQRL